MRRWLTFFFALLTASALANAPEPKLFPLTNRLDAIAGILSSYDANNNLTSVVESGQTNAWTYDAYDRVATYKDADGNLLQYRYDGNGNLTNLVYPGSRNVFYAYDSLNRLTNVTDWGNRKSSIEYDLASRVRKITRPNGTVRTMDYDDAGQTTNILEQMGNTLPIAWFRLNWTNTGAMAWEFAAPLPHSTTVPTRTMTYDDDNRLATFNGAAVTNDLDGNLTYAPLTNNTFINYTYDARHRLVGTAVPSGPTLSFGYDALNNRTSITNGTNVARFLINPNAHLSQVLMRTRGGVTNYYIYGLGLLYEVTETATTTNTATYHYDYRGSTVSITDGTGRITDRIEYSLYGLTTYRAGSTDTPFLYNGRYGVQSDPNGLLYMRARYYNPYLCRFLNADPSGFAAGLNFYAYANGNPTSLIDPFGLGAFGEGRTFSWIDTIGLPSPPLRPPPRSFADIFYPVTPPPYPGAYLPPDTGSSILYNDGLTLGSSLFGPQRDIVAEITANLYLTALTPGGGGSAGRIGATAEETVAVYHGTTTSAARNILSGGFRGGVDNAVFFGEEYSTAAAFGELRVAETGARSGQVLRFTMPQSLAGDLGLTTRNVLGEFRAAAPIDIPGGTGFERILSGGNINAFNQALRNGQISVKPLGIRP